MPTLGIDGLSSGLDTTGIINQLMELERQPAVRLEQRILGNQKAIAALTTLSTRFSAVEAAAKALTDATTSFVPRKATSSAAHVTATATAGAPLGTTAFTVEQLAATHRVVTTGTVADGDTVVSAGGTTITVDGVDVEIAAGATLRDVATAINATEGLDVTAQIVNTGSGLKLQLSTSEAGDAGQFTVDLGALDDAAFTGGTGTAVLTQGQDARVRVGTEGTPGSYTITSPTNTFTGVLEGLTFTVTEVTDQEVTVGVTDDPGALTSKVKAFVDAVNAALGALDKELDSGITSGAAGTLPGDAAMRSLRDQLLSAVTYAVPGSSLGSGGLAGIQSTRTGTLEFDEAAFKAALEEDPAAVQALFRSGDESQPAIADRVQALAKQAVRSNDGTIATAIQGRESQNRQFTDQISAIDRRVEMRRQTMVRQWAALEVALGGMQSQLDWLSSQIGAMNANNAASRR